MFDSCNVLIEINKIAEEVPIHKITSQVGFKIPFLPDL